MLHRGWVLLHGLLHKLRRRNVPQAKPMDVLNGTLSCQSLSLTTT